MNVKTNFLLFLTRIELSIFTHRSLLFFVYTHLTLFHIYLTNIKTKKSNFLRLTSLIEIELRLIFSCLF